MRKIMAGLVLLLFSLQVSSAFGQSAKYPPLSEYMMAQDLEIALAKSAAPENISGHATIKVLTASGFQTIHDGDNGFVCMVMRAFSAPSYTPAQFREIVYDPTIRPPICFSAPAARMVMPYYELRTKLALEGKGPDQIAEGVQAAYVKGGLPRRDGVSFCVHVVGRSESWIRNWSLAPSHDGLLPLLRKFDGWRQRIRESASAGERRRWNTVYGSGHPNRRPASRQSPREIARWQASRRCFRVITSSHNRVWMMA